MTSNQARPVKAGPYRLKIPQGYDDKGGVDANLWKALVGRTVIVAVSALTLVGLMVADQVAQPERVKVPAAGQFRFERI